MTPERELPEQQPRVETGFAWPTFPVQYAVINEQGKVAALWDKLAWAKDDAACVSKSNGVQYRVAKLELTFVEWMT